MSFTYGFLGKQNKELLEGCRNRETDADHVKKDDVESYRKLQAKAFMLGKSLFGGRRELTNKKDLIGVLLMYNENYYSMNQTIASIAANIALDGGESYLQNFELVIVLDGVEKINVSSTNEENKNLLFDTLRDFGDKEMLKSNFFATSGKGAESCVPNINYSMIEDNSKFSMHGYNVFDDGIKMISTHVVHRKFWMLNKDELGSGTGKLTGEQKKQFLNAIKYINKCEANHAEAFFSSEDEYQLKPPVDRASNGEAEADLLVTFKWQRFRQRDIEAYHSLHNSNPLINVKFVIKAHNKLKAHSHCLAANLCHGYTDHIFFMDCGSVFESNTVGRLLSKFKADEKKEYIGLTARQRSMVPQKLIKRITSTLFRRFLLEKREGDYNALLTEAEDNSLPNMWSWLVGVVSLQAAEFESTFLLNMEAFNLIGSLPVMPGPCQMYELNMLLETRAFDSRQVQASIIEAYFYKTQLTQSITMMKSCRIDTNENRALGKVFFKNSKLAEDRIMSYLAVRMTNKRTEWVEGTCFYYEPMKTVVDLIEQRRRWNNGTLFVTLDLIFGHPVGDKLVGARRVMNDFFLLFMLWMFIATLLSPCIVLFSISTATIYLNQLYGSTGLRYYGYFLGYLWFFSILLFAACTIPSVGGMKKQSKGNLALTRLCYFCMIVSVMVTSFVLFAFFAYLTSTSNIELFQIFGILIFAAPFVLATLHMEPSIIIVYGSCFLQYGFCMLFYTYFQTYYSMTQLHNFAWGVGSSESDNQNRCLTFVADAFRPLLCCFNLCGYAVFTEPRSANDAANDISLVEEKGYKEKIDENDIEGEGKLEGEEGQRWLNFTALALSNFVSIWIILANVILCFLALLTIDQEYGNPLGVAIAKGVMVTVFFLLFFTPVVVNLIACAFAFARRLVMFLAGTGNFL